MNIAAEPGWYAMHDHGDGQPGHIHSTVQGHSGDVRNPLANDHDGVPVLATIEAARAAERHTR